MKKNLILICMFFMQTALYSVANAQTAKEIIYACIDAMKSEKSEAFKSITAKASLYMQGQKSSFRYYFRDETAEESSATRFEMSSMGNTEAFVLTEDEFFKVLPQFEALEQEDAMAPMQYVGMMFASMDMAEFKKDTTGKLDSMLTLTSGETFNGKKCNKVTLSSIPEGGGATVPSQYFYIDAISNFLLGVEMPEAKLTMQFEGMKKIKGGDGVVYASTVKVLNQGKKVLEIEIDSLEANAQLDDTLFAKPN